MDKNGCLARYIYVCGGVKVEAARRIGVTRQMLGEWCRRGYIPPVYALEVESASGGAILAKQIVQEAHDALRGPKSTQGRRKAMGV